MAIDVMRLFFEEIATALRDTVNDDVRGRVLRQLRGRWVQEQGGPVKTVVDNILRDEFKPG